MIYDIDGWANHSRAEAIARRAPGDFEVRMGRYDSPTAAERLEAILGDSPLTLSSCSATMSTRRTAG